MLLLTDCEVKSQSSFLDLRIEPKIHAANVYNIASIHLSFGQKFLIMFTIVVLQGIPPFLKQGNACVK